MTIFILLLLLQSELIFGDVQKSTCESSPYDLCRTSDDDFGFPESEEDINKICPLIINHIECLHNYDEMCAPDGPRTFTLDQYQRIRTLMGDLCNKNSLLHKVITENIGCIKQSVLKHNESCFSSKHQVRNALARHWENVRPEDESMEYDPTFNCVYNAHDVACFVGEISVNCGAMAKTAVLDIVRRSSLVATDFCAPKEAQEAVLLIENLELPSRERDTLRDLFEGIYAP